MALYREFTTFVKWIISNFYFLLIKIVDERECLKHPIKIVREFAKTSQKSKQKPQCKVSSDREMFTSKIRLATLWCPNKIIKFEPSAIFYYWVIFTFKSVFSKNFFQLWLSFLNIISVSIAPFHRKSYKFTKFILASIFGNKNM